jgi:hypothetical protein
MYNSDIDEPDTGNNSGLLIQVAGGIAPYSYLWSTGDTTNHPMNLGVGNYSLTVTDVLGCMAEYNFFLISSTDELLPGFNEITVFPNPLAENHDLNLVISRNAPAPQTLVITLHDAQGRTTQAQQMVLHTEEEHLRYRRADCIRVFICHSG